MATYAAYLIPGISDTLAHFQAWGQVFGAGFTTAGWAAQSGHGEVAATGTGASYAWTSVTLPTTALRAMQTYRFNGAWVSGATYTGGNTINGSTVTDLVTSGGVTYVHITASSNSATAPGSDTTNWQPYIYEIWKSAGSNTTSLPIYVRIVYTENNTTGPCIHMSIGTGVDANGNLTGTMQIGPTAPTYNVEVTMNAAGNAGTGTCLFAGDSDNIRWCMWQGLAAAGYQWTMVIDRSKTASGTDTDAFVSVNYIHPVTGATRIGSSVIMNSSISLTPASQFIAAGPAGWVGGVFAGFQTGSIAAFANTPPLPVYPVVGYLANPLKGVVGFQSADVTDGSIMPVWIYGGSHSYIAIKTNTSNSNGPNIGGVASGVIPALLWE